MNRFPKVRAIGLALATITAPALVSCSDDSNKGVGDVPVGYFDGNEPLILENADGFPNIAIRCRNGEAFYVTKDDGVGGQRFAFEADSPQCHGDQVIIKPSDRKGSNSRRGEGFVLESRTTTTTSLPR